MDAIVGFTFYRNLGLLCGVLLSTAALAGGGYLARVGPKPLRFEEAAPRRDPEKVLPPLTMTELAPTNSPPVTEEFGPQPPPISGPPGIDEEWMDPGSVETPAPDPMTAAPKPVTPDSLLQFFTPSRRKDTVIATPVEFTPPPPNSVGGKSSTATFSSQ